MFCRLDGLCSLIAWTLGLWYPAFPVLKNEFTKAEIWSEGINCISTLKLSCVHVGRLQSQSASPAFDFSHFAVCFLPFGLTARRSQTISTTVIYIWECTHSAKSVLWSCAVHTMEMPGDRELSLIQGIQVTLYVGYWISSEKFSLMNNLLSDDDGRFWASC